MTTRQLLLITISSVILLLSFIAHAFPGDDQFKRIRMHHELLARQYDQESRRLCVKAKEECIQQNLRKEIKLDHPLNLYKRSGLEYKKFRALPRLTPFFIKGKVKKFYKITYCDDGKKRTVLVPQTEIKDSIEKDCQILFDNCLEQ